jgi:hypothetical protein
VTLVVTVQQVNDYLSNPPWSAHQASTCELLLARRQSELERWMRCPIDPVERTEVVPILRRTGVVATSAPVFRVIDIDGVIAGGSATYGMALPAPYSWREEGWIGVPVVANTLAYMSRPFSLIVPQDYDQSVAMHYMAGWGPVSDIVGAIVAKVGATMLNRHDDTVTARALDAKEPPPIKEEWTDNELLMLRSRRRLRGGG